MLGAWVHRGGCPRAGVGTGTLAFSAGDEQVIAAYSDGGGIPFRRNESHRGLWRFRRDNAEIEHGHGVQRGGRDE